MTNRIKRVSYKSATAEELAGRNLTSAEIDLIQILAYCEEKESFISAAELQETFRGRQTYNGMLEFFLANRIINRRTNFIFKGVGHQDNRCRRFELNRAVLKEVLSKENPVFKFKNLDLTPIAGLVDNSIISDDVTAATFENLGKLTLDMVGLKTATIEMGTWLVLRRFISGIKSVKKSKKTGRISHILLQAGSKALREFLLINGKKPLDFDMVSAHWQFVAQNLAAQDAAKVNEWLAAGFYETVMAGTGLKDRTQVKKMSQQILTNKRIHPVAAKIRNFVFAELPSLKNYCESVWNTGSTMQCTLQRMESTLINSIGATLAAQGKWFVTFYDGLWIESESLPILEKMMGNYIFEQK